MRTIVVGVTGFVRPPVGQALADDALGRDLGARVVVDAMGHAVVVAEIKFGKVAMQMVG